jgi:hypothetical protein
VLIWKQLSETEKFLELGIYLKDLRRIIEHWSIEFAFQLCYLYIKIHTVDNMKIALTFLSSPTHTRFKKKIKKSKDACHICYKNSDVKIYFSFHLFEYEYEHIVYTIPIV